MFDATEAEAASKSINRGRCVDLKNAFLGEPSDWLRHHKYFGFEVHLKKRIVNIFLNSFLIDEKPLVNSEPYFLPLTTKFSPLFLCNFFFSFM